VLNTITRNYGENLPVICIVGRPNSNDYGPKHVLHHTIPPPPEGALGARGAAYWP
jgi:TPP-dependent 2-oxoacid decarboxylase